MRLAVLKERRPGETRVAATPETVRKLVQLGITVAVEAGAGAGASIGDAAYAEAGAEVAKDTAATLAHAGIVFAVQLPDAAILPRGALLVCISGAMADKQVVGPFAAAGVNLAAMELLPRITRAQSMDVLSSQANLAGYRAVIEGAYAFDRGFPMMMTAAGTVPPARVFVMGAGVAGLQAIATARRLGAIVSATDVRPAAKEEIKSLGASFIGVEDAETASQTGAYAKEMSAEYRQKQAELIAATVAKNDLVICTALVQGGRAPTLVTQAMVDSMRPGSVIVDLASDGGGNCAATRPGEAHTTANGVKILGYHNWPGRIGVAASTLYAKNLLTFLSTFWDKDAKAPNFPPEDAIVQGVMVTRDGTVVHPAFGEVKVTPGAVSASPAPAAPDEQPPASAAPKPAAQPASAPEANAHTEPPIPVTSEAISAPNPPSGTDTTFPKTAAPPEPAISPQVRVGDPAVASAARPAQPKAGGRKPASAPASKAGSSPPQKPMGTAAKSGQKSTGPAEKPKQPPTRPAPDTSGESA